MLQGAHIGADAGFRDAKLFHQVVQAERIWTQHQCAEELAHHFAEPKIARKLAQALDNAGIDRLEGLVK